MEKNKKIRDGIEDFFMCLTIEEINEQIAINRLQLFFNELHLHIFRMFDNKHSKGIIFTRALLYESPTLHEIKTNIAKYLHDGTYIDDYIDKDKNTNIYKFILDIIDNISNKSAKILGHQRSLIFKTQTATSQKDFNKYFKNSLNFLSQMHEGYIDALSRQRSTSKSGRSNQIDLYKLILKKQNRGDIYKELLNIMDYDYYMIYSVLFSFLNSNISSTVSQDIINAAKNLYFFKSPKVLKTIRFSNFECLRSNYTTGEKCTFIEAIQQTVSYKSIKKDIGRGTKFHGQDIESSDSFMMNYLGEDPSKNAPGIAKIQHQDINAILIDAFKENRTFKYTENGINYYLLPDAGYSYFDYYYDPVKKIYILFVNWNIFTVQIHREDESQNNLLLAYLDRQGRLKSFDISDNVSEHTKRGLNCIVKCKSTRFSIGVNPHTFRQQHGGNADSIAPIMKITAVFEVFDDFMRPKELNISLMASNITLSNQFKSSLINPTSLESYSDCLFKKSDYPYHPLNRYPEGEINRNALPQNDDLASLYGKIHTRIRR